MLVLAPAAPYVLAGCKKNLRCSRNLILGIIYIPGYSAAAGAQVSHTLFLTVVDLSYSKYCRAYNSSNRLPTGFQLSLAAPIHAPMRRNDVSISSPEATCTWYTSRRCVDRANCDIAVYRCKSPTHAREICSGGISPVQNDHSLYCLQGVGVHSRVMSTTCCCCCSCCSTVRLQHPEPLSGVVAESLVECTLLWNLYLQEGFFCPSVRSTGRTFERWLPPPLSNDCTILLIFELTYSHTVDHTEKPRGKTYSENFSFIVG